MQSVCRNEKDRKELTSYSALHRSIVTVYVGPEQYPFYLHGGRLCQHSSFFEKRSDESFQDATTGSVYLEEYGVDEFKIFEEWLYSDKVNYPKQANDPSLILVRAFCLAKDVEISKLQNVILDVIRDRATEQHVSPTAPKTYHEIDAEPQNFLRSVQRPVLGLQGFQTTPTSSGFKEPAAEYLPPATASAVHYAYRNTSEHSPLRKLLTDIFAYDVKPEALYGDDRLSFPAQFMADVLFITKKRLPLRLKGEEADFDKNADKYHVQESSSACKKREQQRETVSEVDWREGAVPEAAEPESEPTIEPDYPEPEPPATAVATNEVVEWDVGEPVRSSTKKDKKRKKKEKLYDME